MPETKSKRRIRIPERKDRGVLNWPRLRHARAKRDIEHVATRRIDLPLIIARHVKIFWIEKSSFDSLYINQVEVKDGYL